MCRPPARSSYRNDRQRDHTVVQAVQVDLRHLPLGFWRGGRGCREFCIRRTRGGGGLCVVGRAAARLGGLGSRRRRRRHRRRRWGVFLGLLFIAFRQEGRRRVISENQREQPGRILEAEVDLRPHDGGRKCAVRSKVKIFPVLVEDRVVVAVFAVADHKGFVPWDRVKHQALQVIGIRFGVGEPLTVRRPVDRSDWGDQAGIYEDRLFIGEGDHPEMHGDIGIGQDFTVGRPEDRVTIDMSVEGQARFGSAAVLGPDIKFIFTGPIGKVGIYLPLGDHVGLFSRIPGVFVISRVSPFFAGNREKIPPCLENSPRSRGRDAESADIVFDAAQRRPDRGQIALHLNVDRSDFFRFRSKTLMSPPCSKTIASGPRLGDLTS